jgi:secreted trypsin-like serine protease
MKFLVLGTFLLAVSFVNCDEARAIDSRITGGISATSSTARCYVSMQIDSDAWVQKICGGCLILPQNMVVTAASCVFSSNEGKASSIRFYTTLSGPAGSPNSQFQVDEIYKAPAFDASSNTSGSDIAVIKLKRPITQTSTLKGAWPSSEEKSDAFVGEDLVVCGHGNIDNNRTRPGSRGLQCTTLRVVPVKECMALL